MPPTFTLRAGHLTLADLRRLEAGGVAVALDPAAHQAIDASVETVRAVIRENRTVYGVNTGFGSLARTRIADAELAELQRRLVLSHAAGTGPALSDRVVRLVLLLKANGLARGHSGVRREAIEMLLTLYGAEALPVIPAKGSVGASGDLAPLAHMTAAMIGQGEIKLAGEVMPAEAALAALALKPLALEAKEGLALLNGTQVSTALAAAALLDAERLFQAALVSGSLCVDAAAGSDVPFDPRIQAVRGQLGQIEVAKLYRTILSSSEIRQSHIDCDRVQDPYSLRCQPQVMGAALDMLRFAAGVVEREMNAVSDNPLVFADKGEILSGGNFHAEPVAMAADAAAIALSEIGSIAERRIALLTDSRMSGLPAFLVPEPGLNSGFMIAHVTAAALASENKGLSHPASVDSLPTSANQEDHVSMATWGARRLHDIADNVTAIVAIELLAAAQGVELRRPLKTSPTLEPVMAAIRKKAAFWDQDRAMAPDIEAVKGLIERGAFREASGFSLF
ncbi:histidine ammonia-lyase [Hypericibacter terrae]|uniref:Histidine ammonia-lyase n=1 Tax=Hypericibacter terrae TaxID=2602015 RepID=A0A5J6MS67_9PROT|nr:histidine ammonia-lyase [Hypericibacter terrae]QEX19525.1 histidine ammonia-lyase [Hypericibacter terrae]